MICDRPTCACFFHIRVLTGPVQCSSEHQSRLTTSSTQSHLIDPVTGIATLKFGRGLSNDFRAIEFLPTPVPVPAAVWLFGSGLAGIIGLARRAKTH